MPAGKILLDAISQRRPLIVGAVSDSEGLSLDNSDCDLVELRVDSLGVSDEVMNFAKKSTTPLLITARGPEEGGQNRLTWDERRRMYLTLIPYASAIDVELRDHGFLSDIISIAQESDVVVVGSFHNFSHTPSLSELSSKIGNTCDIHKFATLIKTEPDLKVHRDLLEFDHPLSVMGMGPIGAEARPEMMNRGSILNYGYLGDIPTAPNQWPVAKLKEARDS